jgi:glutathione S-transferase
MTEPAVHALILHHFDWSPFAEKSRLALAFKGVPWMSVQIPMIMPKPDLTALTGGYRKTPVLQIGADVYCDTNLIARVLERKFPNPSLFDGGARGLAQSLSFWADKAFFEPAAGLSMGLSKEVPSAVIEDRKRFFNFMNFDRLEQDLPHLTTQLIGHLDLVEQNLGDGRAFYLGERPTLADINVYFVVWLCRTFIAPMTEFLNALPRTQAWESRCKSLLETRGAGKRTEISAEAALSVARETAFDSGDGVDAADPLQLRAGQHVSVSADDYGKDAVVGTLHTLQRHEVVVLREDARAGTVAVHFPRLGYRVAAS